MIDGRVLNWRYTVPAQRRRLLLLPVGDERIANAVVPERNEGGLELALSGDPYATVAAPDLSAWALATSDTPAALLHRLARAVEPAGWLYAGFPNAWYAARPLRARSLSLRAASASVRAAGLTDVQPYVLLPDQTCPAFLIGAGRRHELDYFLSQLFFPYSAARTARAALLRGFLLSALAGLAKRSPHAVRVHLAPALALVARRPA